MAKTKSRRNGDTGNRFLVLNTFVDFSLRDLSKNESAVWLVLYRDSRNGSATVSQKSIAERCGVSERTVRRMVVNLVKAGLLRVVRRGGIAKGASTYLVIPVTKENYHSRKKFVPATADTKLSS